MTELPCFERATRRAFLRRGVAASGLLAAGAVLAACSDDDASSFGSSTIADPTIPPTSPVRVETVPPASPGSVAGTAPGTAPVTEETGAARSMTITVNYAALASGRRVRNPYLAVWMENEAGEMTALISLIYLAREAKYLREMSAVFSHLQGADEAAIDAVTGSTRSAGAYSFTFDGLGLDGKPLSGVQTLFIESAREHGPHSLVSAAVTVGQPGTVTLPDDGELSAATVTVG